MSDEKSDSGEAEVLDDDVSEAEESEATSDSEVSEVSEAEFSAEFDEPEVSDTTSATRYKFVVFALLLLAAMLTIAGATRFWLPPDIPLFLYGLLGVGPLLFWSLIGAFVFDPTKTSDGIVKGSSPPLRERLRMALVPVLISAVAAGTLVAAWWFPSARAAWAGVLASQRYVQPLEGALTDRNAEVRLAACEALAEEGIDTSAELLMSLTDVDDRIVDCALKAIPSQPVASPQLNAMSTQWQNELMTTADERATGDRACQLADRLRTAERKGLKQSSMYLMSCALDAESAPARECCTQSFRALLGGQDVEPAMVMLPPAELVRMGFVQTLPSVLAATHSDDPKWESRRQNMHLDTPSSKAWSMAVACEALSAGGAQSRDLVSKWMADAVSTESCDIGPATETTVRLWNAVCTDLYTPARITAATGEESEVFCNAINGTLVVDAANEARYAVQRSIRGAKDPGRRREMMRALLSYGGQMASAVMDGDVNTTPADPSILFGQDGPPTDGSLGNGMLSEMFKVMLGGDPSAATQERRRNRAAGGDMFHRKLIEQGMRRAEKRMGFDVDDSNDASGSASDFQ